MSKEIITEARELCEKATPGPWGSRIDVGKKYYVFTPGYGVRDFCCLSGGFEHESDAAFIARSRTLIPELCDALESYKSFADRIAKLPDCNDCASNRDCPYLPNWGTTTRINCPLHKPLPAPPEKGE